MSNEQIDALRLLFTQATVESRTALSRYDPRLKAANDLYDFRRGKNRFDLQHAAERGSAQEALYQAVYRYFTGHRSKPLTPAIRGLLTLAYTHQGEEVLIDVGKAYFSAKADRSAELRHDILVGYSGMFWVFRYLEPRHNDAPPQIGATLLQVIPPKEEEEFVPYRAWYRRYGHLGKRAIAGIEGRIFPINRQLFWAGYLTLNGSPYLHVTALEKDGPEGVEAFHSVMLHHSFTDTYMSARAYAMRIHPAAEATKLGIEGQLERYRERAGHFKEEAFCALDFAERFEITAVNGVDILDHLSNRTPAENKLPLARLR